MTAADQTRNLRIGLKLQQAGKLAEAERIYRAVLRTEPGNAEAQNLLGLARLQDGDAAAALRLITQAASAAPGNAKYLSNLGEIHHRTGHETEAADAFRRALKLEPGLQGVDAKLGRTLMGLDEVPEAVEAFRRALKADGESAGGLNNLGAAYARLDLMADALNCWRRATALDPGHAGALANLGVALRELGRPEEAIEAYRKALAIDPELTEAHCSLGTALRECGLTSEAEESFERALALRPDFVDALYMHALVHSFVPGDPCLARLYEALDNPQLPEDDETTLQFALGRALHDIGDYAAAFESFAAANDKIAALQPFSRPAHRVVIKEIRESFGRSAATDRKIEQEEQQIPVFVVGLSRSGKTLVESLLMQDPSVHGAGENVEMAKALEAVLQRHGITKNLITTVPDLSSEVLHEIGERYMADISSRSPQSRFFVNTSPVNYEYVGLIFRALPHARVIFCRRDPLDNCLSIFFSRYRRRHEYSYRLADIASYHADYTGLQDHWREQYAERIFDVQYEDLVRRPVVQTAAIFEYCGLEMTDPVDISHVHGDEIGHWRNYEVELAELISKFT